MGAADQRVFTGHANDGSSSASCHDGGGKDHIDLLMRCQIAVIGEGSVFPNGTLGFGDA